LGDQTAIGLLKAWYEAHRSRPYASDAEVRQLAAGDRVPAGRAPGAEMAVEQASNGRQHSTSQQTGAQRQSQQVDVGQCATGLA